MPYYHIWCKCLPKNVTKNTFRTVLKILTDRYTISINKNVIFKSESILLFIFFIKIQYTIYIIIAEFEDLLLNCLTSGILFIFRRNNRKLIELTLNNNKYSIYKLILVSATLLPTFILYFLVISSQSKYCYRVGYTHTN